MISTVKTNMIIIRIMMMVTTTIILTLNTVVKIADIIMITKH